MSRVQHDETISAKVTEEQYRRALVSAEQYLRKAHELHQRARALEAASSARLLSAERSLDIARQVLARIQMLGRQFDRN
jgi:hypothetical protein